jgi:hypothetical protein
VGKFFITIYTPLPEHVNLCGSLASAKQGHGRQGPGHMEGINGLFGNMAESPQPNLWRMALLVTHRSAWCKSAY